MEWGSFSQPPLCTVFGCVFLYTQLSNGIIDSRPINHDISMIPDDRTWLLKCWSSCFWVGCGHGRQAWERSQRSIAGESWVAQLRFSGLCGHGPMAIPLDFDGDITDGSLIFRNLKTWNIWKPNIWQMFIQSKFNEKKHVPSPQWIFSTYYLRIVRVFHTMRVPISPLETSNHLDDSLGSSCRSEPKVGNTSTIHWFTILFPMFSCQLWNHIEMLFIHV